MKEDVLSVISPQNIFFRNLQEPNVLSAVAKTKPSSERETRVTFHRAVVLQATENKVARGKRRERTLSAMTLGRERQGGWE